MKHAIQLEGVEVARIVANFLKNHDIPLDTYSDGNHVKPRVSVIIDGRSVKVDAFDMTIGVEPHVVDNRKLTDEIYRLKIS
jgi:hypothetical protein